MKRTTKRIVSILLVMAVISIFSISVFAKDFSDVKSGKWYYTPIMYCQERGIVSGYTNGTFKPNNNITRAEFCVMLNKVADNLGLKKKAITDAINKDSYAKAFSRMGKAISRTYIFGFAALALILVIGIITSYANVRHRSTITKTVDTLTFFPFIVPGAVLGIATILAFNGKPFYLTGTSIIIIAIWVIRRLPYTIRSSTSVLHQIGASVEEASQSLGANGIHTFFKVTLPMMFAGILPGALLSWVSCITELSSSLFVYNNKNMTMSIAIYTQILKGNMGIASAMSTILLVSAATVLTILFTSSKGKMDFGL